jgi:hypothetical protein
MNSALKRLLTNEQPPVRSFDEMDLARFDSPEDGTGIYVRNECGLVGRHHQDLG